MEFAWIKAARPKTLVAAIVPVYLGSVLAYWLTGSTSIGLALWTLFSAISIQIATNLFNDYLDWKKGADTIKRLGPTRMSAAGALKPTLVWKVACVWLVVAVLCALPLVYLRGWPIVVIGIASLYFSFGYTGGPFPLAYRGMGEFFVLLFFGWIAVLGTVFLQTGSWFFTESMLLGTQVGLWSVALIAVNNLRDVEEDSQSGKRTLAVRFGVLFARWQISCCVLLALLLGLGWAFVSEASFLVASLPLLGLVLSGWIVVQVFQNLGASLNRVLERCALGLVVFSLLWSLAVFVETWQ